MSNIARLIARTWLGAETELRSVLKTRYWDEDEEFITTLLRGELRHAFGQVRSDELSAALRDDILAQWPEADRDSVNAATAFLEARVAFHPRHIESHSGADLGIIVTQPRLETFGDARRLIPHRQGLLVQVKIRQRSSRWGSFTANQLRALAGHEPHTSLLLYEYSDAKRRLLKPLRWRPFRSLRVDKVAALLHRDNIGETIDSQAAVSQIASGVLGTENVQTLEAVISPALRDTLVIELTLPNHSPDPVVVAERNQVIVHTS